MKILPFVFKNSLFFSILTISACSFQPNLIMPDVPKEDVETEYHFSKKIQNLIVSCALPARYYSWHNSGPLKIRWHTTGQSVQVESITAPSLQQCVERSYKAQPFTFHSGMSGSITIE